MNDGGSPQISKMLSGVELVDGSLKGGSELLLHPRE